MQDQEIDTKLVTVEDTWNQERSTEDLRMFVAERLGMPALNDIELVA